MTDRGKDEKEESGRNRQPKLHKQREARLVQSSPPHHALSRCVAHKRMLSQAGAAAAELRWACNSYTARIMQQLRQRLRRDRAEEATVT